MKILKRQNKPFDEKLVNVYIKPPIGGDIFNDYFTFTDWRQQNLEIRQFNSTLK